VRISGGFRCMYMRGTRRKCADGLKSPNYAHPNAATQCASAPNHLRRTSLPALQQGQGEFVF